MKPKFADYSFEIKPLTAAEGGGFLITFPDLPGCMSDGETPEEAIENGKNAFDCWIEAQVEWGETNTVALLYRNARQGYSAGCKKPPCKALRSYQAGGRQHQYAGPVLHRGRRWDGEGACRESRGMS